MLLSTLALAGAAQENAPVEAKEAQPPVPSAASPQAVTSDYDYRLVRLYDLSALGAALSSPGTPPGQIERQLVAAISDSFDVLVSPISNSVFMIGAGPETHTRIEALLGQIRSSTAERFKVQLVTLTLPADKAAPVGSELTYASSNVGTRIDHIVQLRGRAAFESLQSQTYIADWQPIVGTDSVGYQPQSKVATSGVEAMVVIGGVDEESVEIRLEGQVSQTSITSVDLPLAQGGAKLTIGLPQREQRSIHAEAKVRMGAPTVLSVSSGFKPGEVILSIMKVELVQ
jgi:hypothetical protein